MGVNWSQKQILQQKLPVEASQLTGEPSLGGAAQMEDYELQKWWLLLKAIKFCNGLQTKTIEKVGRMFRDG